MLLHEPALDELSKNIFKTRFEWPWKSGFDPGNRGLWPRPIWLCNAIKSAYTIVVCGKLHDLYAKIQKTRFLLTFSAEYSTLSFTNRCDVITKPWHVALQRSDALHSVSFGVKDSRWFRGHVAIRMTPFFMRSGKLKRGSIVYLAIKGVDQHPLPNNAWENWWHPRFLRQSQISTPMTILSVNLS